MREVVAHREIGLRYKSSWSEDQKHGRWSVRIIQSYDGRTTRSRGRGIWREEGGKVLERHVEGTRSERGRS